MIGFFKTNPSGGNSALRLGDQRACESLPGWLGGFLTNHMTKTVERLRDKPVTTA